MTRPAASPLVLLALVALVPVLVAGCSGGPPVPAQEPSSGQPCSAVPLEGACVQPWDVTAVLEGCVQARAVVELDRVVYALPPGYENDATPASPQRLSVAFARCGSLALGPVAAADVSWGHVGVLVLGGDRDQAERADSLDVEVVTDHPGLAAVFRAAGFPVAEATVAIADAVATRHGTVTGAVDYAFDAQVVPLGDGAVGASGDVAGRLPHHSPVGWVDDQRACRQYAGTAAVQVTATRGELARAMPPVGPLVGEASQPFSCVVELAFKQFD